MALNDARVMPTIAVSDMGKAKEFYEGKLGLTGGEEQPDGGTQYPCGGGSVIHVYPSPANAGKSGATLASFEVDDVENRVNELASAGVSFEQYDLEEIKTDDKGIASLGEDQVAWFKDPDGNVMSVWHRS
jgi:catechol 2,3-dioxygenase-like lactoylglutathione lyase family enzyme